MGEVLDNAPEDLRPAEYLTLVVLAEDARDRDRHALYSDLPSLVRRTRLAPGTVRNALSELARRGLIVPQVTNVHRGGKHQTYVLARLHVEHRAAVHRLHADG